MPWGAAAGAAIGLIGDSMNKDKNGGAGSQSQSKEPWAAAQPWLQDNILIGQGYQKEYMTQPFNARQQAALDNTYAQGDYMRGLVPSLLGQMQGQPLGYNKSNPDARAKAYDWGATAGGLMGQRSVAGAQDAPRAAAPAAPVDDRKFVNQGLLTQNWNNTGGGNSDEVLHAQINPQTPIGQAGSFGDFTYGMPMPKPGTKAYKDMSDYFAYGGADPLGRYGRGGGGGLLQYAGGFGAADGGGGSVGGSPASDGSGGGTPGGNW